MDFIDTGMNEDEYGESEDWLRPAADEAVLPPEVIAPISLADEGEAQAGTPANSYNALQRFLNSPAFEHKKTRIKSQREQEEYLPPPRPSLIEEYSIQEQKEKINPRNQNIIERLLENSGVRAPEQNSSDFNLPLLPRPRTVREPVRDPVFAGQLRLAQEALRRMRETAAAETEAAPAPHIQEQIAEEEAVPPRPEPLRVDPATAERHRRAYEAVLVQMQPAPERPAQPADEVESALTEWLGWRSERWGNTARTQLRELERDRDFYDARIKEIGQQVLPALRNELRDQRAAVDRAREALAGENNEAAVQAELERLLEHPAVVGFQVEGRGRDKALFALLRVFGQYFSTNTVYDLGDWRLRLDTTAAEDRRPFFQQLRSGRTDGRDHRRSTADGFVFCDCKDEYGHILLDLNNGDYTGAINRALAGIVHEDSLEGRQLLASANIITDPVPIAISDIQWVNERRGLRW